MASKRSQLFKGFKRVNKKAFWDFLERYPRLLDRHVITICFPEQVWFHDFSQDEEHNVVARWTFTFKNPRKLKGEYRCYYLSKYWLDKLEKGELVLKPKREKPRVFDVYSIQELKELSEKLKQNNDIELGDIIVAHHISIYKGQVHTITWKCVNVFNQYNFDVVSQVLETELPKEE